MIHLNTLLRVSPILYYNLCYFAQGRDKIIYFNETLSRPRDRQKNTFLYILLFLLRARQSNIYFLYHWRSRQPIKLFILKCMLSLPPGRDKWKYFFYFTLYVVSPLGETTYEFLKTIDLAGILNFRIYIYSHNHQTNLPLTSFLFHLFHCYA